VTTGRNCLAIHISEQHSCQHNHNKITKWKSSLKKSSGATGEFLST
jgi:hypothetical protein